MFPEFVAMLGRVILIHLHYSERKFALLETFTTCEIVQSMTQSENMGEIK